MTYPDTLADGGLGPVIASGVDGMLLPERIEDDEEVSAALRSQGLALARFVSCPPDPRELDATLTARGYVMVQARPGPTGDGEPGPELADTLAALREAGVTAPLAVGFGIRDAETARGVAALGADAVIVGSAALDAALAGPDRLRELVHSLRQALDG